MTSPSPPSPVTPDRPSLHDYFSGQARVYAAFRPQYPARLFDWLKEIAPAATTVWECGCGSGQASASLAQRFDTVIATDASAAQVDAVTLNMPNLSFRVAPAEASGLPPASVDLVCIAQALHWFDPEAFYAETRRVLRSGGLIVAWMYGSPSIDGPAGRVLSQFEHDTMAPWWPSRRRWINDSYRQVSLPGTALLTPVFAMQQDWPLAGVLGYVESWSAVQRCRDATGEDPIAAFRTALEAHWGDPAAARTVRWPLIVRASQL